MARCGCQGAGSTTCEAIVRCVAANLGPGLSFTNGRIQVRLSRDAGNCLRYGSDQGLFAPCDGGGPGPGPGGRTVEGLPDAVFAGNGGGAYLINAAASPAAIEYAVAQQIDVISVDSWALIDQVAAWAPRSPNSAISFYTTSASGAQGRTLSSGEWVQLLSDAGVPGGNPTGRNSGAPEGELEPDGGWYGWQQPPYQLMTTITGLQMVNARAVVFLQHRNPGDYDVMANMQAILVTQTQESVIPFVGTTGLTSVTEYLNVGINHVGVNIGSDDTITPQQIIDSGATWVEIDEIRGIPRVQEFVDAGLQVISGYDGRQTLVNQLLNDVGVRGILTSDPVYARGALPEFRNYRTNTIPMTSKQTVVGTLTSETDNGDVLEGPGYAELDESGRFFNGEFGWVDGIKRFNPSQTLGSICPLPETENYTLSMDVQVDQGTLPTGDYQYLGMTFASDNDLDPSRFLGTPVQTTRHGYLATIRVGTVNTGRLELGVFSATGVYSVLATSATMNPVTPNAWVTLELQVTPTDLTLTRTDGTPYSVTATDSTWRGPYAFHSWQDTSSSTVFTAFAHGYRDVVYTPAGSGNANWNQLAIDFANWAEMAAANPTWEDLATPDPGAISEPPIEGTP